MRTIFIAVYSTHQTFSEGGRKTHLAVKDGGFKTLCGRLERAGLMRNGSLYDIEDIEDWVGGSEKEVCALCVKKARKMEAK